MDCSYCTRDPAVVEAGHGSEKTFTVRAYLALGGYRSTDYDSITITRT